MESESCEIMVLVTEKCSAAWASGGMETAIHELQERWNKWYFMTHWPVWLGKTGRTHATKPRQKNSRKQNKVTDISKANAQLRFATSLGLKKEKQVLLCSETNKKGALKSGSSVTVIHMWCGINRITWGIKNVHPTANRNVLREITWVIKSYSPWIFVHCSLMRLKHRNRSTPVYCETSKWSLMSRT